MRVITYLYFKGQCEAAFRFYEASLGGKIETMLSHTGTPAADHVPREWRNKILHAQLALGDTILLGSDAPPDRYQEPKGFSVSLDAANPAEAERAFNTLATGGTVRVPLEQNFFAIRYGTLIDQFGIPWMVVCEKKG